MHITLRQGHAKDAERSGLICYEAFKAIAEQHHFPPDFPSADVTVGLLLSLRYIITERHGYALCADAAMTLDEAKVVAGQGSAE
jgi:hypothetical protein